jgi:hypothetical protein
MRKGIEFNSTSRSKSSNTLGIVIVFAGMVLLAVTKVLVGSKFGNVTALVSFLAGGLLLALGLAIAQRKKK